MCALQAAYHQASSKEKRIFIANCCCDLNNAADVEQKVINKKIKLDVNRISF